MLLITKINKPTDQLQYLVTHKACYFIKSTLQWPMFCIKTRLGRCAMLEPICTLSMWPIYLYPINNVVIWVKPKLTKSILGNGELTVCGFCSKRVLVAGSPGQISKKGWFHCPSLFYTLKVNWTLSNLKKLTRYFFTSNIVCQ